jgi:hypothetical protein
MTDARLDRTAAAWHREFEAWAIRRNLGNGKREIIRREPGAAIDETATVLMQCRDKIDAEAWLNTYRNRAAARAALEASENLRRRK